MSNFKCPHCGMINIDCGEKGYKTPEQIWLEEENERLKQDLALEREDCASICPNVQLVERYELCLKEIKQYCQEEASKLNCTASDILQKINEVLK